MPTSSHHNPFVGPRPISRTEGLYGRDTKVRESDGDTGEVSVVAGRFVGVHRHALAVATIGGGSGALSPGHHLRDRHKGALHP